MSIYLGNRLISGVATPVEPTRNIGQIITSTIPLTDAGLHLLDGALINGSGIYADFVTAIAELVTDYPDLFTDETTWQNSVLTYGVCGKFVYDSVNNTVRLPKITGITEGTTDVTALGDLITAGLPNITGSVRRIAAGGVGTLGSDGAITYDDVGDCTLGTTGGSNLLQVNIDASLSNPIYGNSLTVQPQSIKVLYYIVLATSAKTDIEVDIDQVTTDLNGKADVDLSNATPAISFANAMNTAGIITIVETYINGTSWYRVYSDGWCEQGSYIGVVGNQDATVTLLKPYRDTNYARQASLNNLGNVSDNININNITNSSFTLYGTTISPAGGWTAGATWQAAGYII